MTELETLTQFIKKFKKDRLCDNIFFNFSLYNSTYSLSSNHRIFFNGIIYDCKIERLKNCYNTMFSVNVSNTNYLEKMLSDTLLKIYNNSFLTDTITIIYLLKVNYEMTNNPATLSQEHLLTLDFIKIEA